MSKRVLKKQKMSGEKRKQVHADNLEEGRKRQKLSEVNQYVVLLHLERGDTWYRKLLELVSVVESLMTCTTCKHVLYSFLIS